MKKKILLLLLVFSTLTAFSQTTFRRGIKLTNPNEVTSFGSNINGIPLMRTTDGLINNWIHSDSLALKSDLNSLTLTLNLQQVTDEGNQTTNTIDFLNNETIGTKIHYVPYTVDGVKFIRFIPGTLTTNSTIGIGSQAALNYVSSNSIAIGNQALSNSTNTNNTNIVAIGTSAVQNGNGQNVTAVGANAMQNTTSNDATAFGSGAISTATGTRLTGIGRSALNQNNANEVTGVGWRAGGVNTGNKSTLIGVDAGFFNTQDNATGVGYYAVKNNTAFNATGVGAYSMENNTQMDSNGHGYNSLRNNNGIQSNGFGTHSLSNNEGSYSNGFGQSSLTDNTGSGVNGFGTGSATNNRGGNVSFMGHLSGQWNIGSSSSGFGSNTLRFNDKDNNTALGSDSFNIYNVDISKKKTFLGSAVNFSTEEITIPNHGFGTNGTTINLLHDTAPYLGGLTPSGDLAYRFLIVDANTIKSEKNITSGDPSFTYSFAPQFDITNTTTVGANSQPTKSNQVVLGDENVDEVYSDGVFKSNVSNAEITDGKHLITLDYLNINSGLLKTNEGSGDGWILKGRDPANYGNVGLQAVDLSQSTTASGLRGATGQYSFASGFWTQASGVSSTAMGNNAKATGTRSFSFGNSTNATNQGSFASGNGTNSTGQYSFTMGNATLASGDYSYANGSSTQAPSFSESAVGSWNTTYTPSGGTTIFNSSDRIYTIGNGTSSGRSDAVTVLKNAQFGIDIDNFEVNTTGEKLQVNGLIKSDVTIAQITQPKHVITKEYFDANSGGGGATNLTYTPSATQGTVVSSTGTDAVIPPADATNAGLMKANFYDEGTYAPVLNAQYTVSNTSSKYIRVGNKVSLTFNVNGISGNVTDGSTFTITLPSSLPIDTSSFSINAEINDFNTGSGGSSITLSNLGVTNSGGLSLVFYDNTNGLSGTSALNNLNFNSGFIRITLTYNTIVYTP